MTDKGTKALTISPPNVLEMMAIAVEKLGGEGAMATVEAIKELAELQIKMSKIDAEKEFNNALAEFQDECPPIKKRSVSQKGATNAGSGFAYRYAELDEIFSTVKPYLSKRGLSFTWDTVVHDGLMDTACTLRHRNGHQISSTFQAPVTGNIGSMNDVQKRGTVLTYTRRYSLIAVLGLTTTEMDTDGVSPETIDDLTIKMLKMKIKEGGVDEARLLKYLKLDRLSDIRKIDVRGVELAIDEKIRQSKLPPEQAELV